MICLVNNKKVQHLVYCSCISIYSSMTNATFLYMHLIPSKPLHGQLLHTWTNKWNVYTQVKPTNRTQINLLDSQPPWSNTNKALLWVCNLCQICQNSQILPLSSRNILSLKSIYYLFPFPQNKFVPYYDKSIVKTENSWSTNSIYFCYRLLFSLHLAKLCF